MNKLSQLLPGETISVIVRVLNEPRKNIINGREMLKVKIGDGEDIANLLAWGKETEKLDIEENDILEITDGECPLSHENTHRPPTLLVTQNTAVDKKQIKFPSIQECMQRKFP